MSPPSAAHAAHRAAHYSAELTWQRQAHESFTDNRYSRRHALRFDGGAELAGSSSPHVVPLPLSDAGAVDPEELFVASLASCHMLWFLSLAASRGYCVDRYADHALGEMARNDMGQLMMTVVTLRPQVTFSGQRVPDETALHELHHARTRIVFHCTFGKDRRALRTAVVNAFQFSLCHWANQKLRIWNQPE